MPVESSWGEEFGDLGGDGFELGRLFVEVERFGTGDAVQQDAPVAVDGRRAVRRAEGGCVTGVDEALFHVGGTGVRIPGKEAQDRGAELLDAGFADGDAERASENGGFEVEGRLKPEVGEEEVGLIARGLQGASMITWSGAKW